MARIARVEVFPPIEIVIVQVLNQTVGRCYVPGNDSQFPSADQGKNGRHVFFGGLTTGFRLLKVGT